MTTQELIEKIIAEIEHRIKANKTKHGFPAGTLCAVRIEAYEDIISLINSLPEEPDKSLKEEMDKFIETFGWGKTKHLAEKELISATTRHFAKWGAEHTPLPEDTVLFNKGVAEGKRLMLEDAVEGEVHKYDKFSYVKEKNSKSLTELLAKFNNNDKVKIIIVKEDSHE